MVACNGITYSHLKNLKMKPQNITTAAKWLVVLFFVSGSFFACKKNIDQPANHDEIALQTKSNKDHGHLKQTKTFSSDVVTKWLNMELDMLRVPLPAGTGSQAADRVLAYNGIALYESVVNGMPSYQSLSGQLTAFPEMPETENGKAYHWAASANAALAYMNRKLFPTTALPNKNAMDALENSLQTQYASEVDAATLQRSIDFGKEVATRIYNWAATDGSANVNPPYPVVAGPGLWVPTAPTPPVNPYYHQRRLLVPGVTQGADIAPPPVYSASPSSDFFGMVKDVYDKSLVLTPDQIAMAIYHRDAPGYPGGGHFVAILSQAISKAECGLDKAALASVKAGIAYHDAVIICFTKKYTVKLVRPITYIRNEMALAAWSPLIPTPNHPEFPSAHAVNAAAVAIALTDVFGNKFSLTDHAYDYLGLTPRTYLSFFAMAKEMSNSRVFGGIHYQATCDNSLLLGGKVGVNVLAIIGFKK